jgi:hypothetical protein
LVVPNKRSAQITQRKWPVPDETMDGAELLDGTVGGDGSMVCGESY